MTIQEDYLIYNSIDNLFNSDTDDFVSIQEDSFASLQDNTFDIEVSSDLSDLESLEVNTSSEQTEESPDESPININLEDFIDTQEDSFKALENSDLPNIEVDNYESIYNQSDITTTNEEPVEDTQEDTINSDIIDNAKIPEVPDIPEVIQQPIQEKPVIKVDTCVINTKESLKKSCFREYNVKTDTVGYQLRGNKHTLPVAQKLYRFKLLFTTIDNTKYIPATVESSIDGTQKCSPNQTPINPFGEILFYNSLNIIDANKIPSTDSLWTQCVVELGYSFNINGSKLNLTKWKPLYVKCKPQQDGSAIIDGSTPYSQALPTTNDGNIYIYLGIVFNDTKFELDNNHLVYYNDGTGIRIWTGKDCYTKEEINTSLANKQDTLISGYNLKTVNNQTLLGSGNIQTSSNEAIEIDTIQELWKQFIIRK